MLWSLMASQATDDAKFLEGKLLIAMPGMGDPRFEKSVVFMLAHSGEGAMGIIVNKPIVGLGFFELLKQLEISVTTHGPDSPILYGGPMQTGRGFVLHSSDYKGHDSTLAFREGISMTATIDILRAIGEGRGPKKALFALGYAGWGPGQIEGEIRANAWIHCDSDQALLFETEPDSKWTQALAKLGIDMSGLSAHAGRA